MNPSPDIRRILVPHDFSESAEHALSYALTFAQKFGGRVTVVHAYEIPTLGASESIVASVEFVEEVARHAGKMLAGIADRARKSNIEVETVLRRGTAWVEINAVAEQMKADLIVMGTHGRKGVSRFLLGSVAEKVVRTAPCPVLTVHAAKAHADAASSRPS